MKTELNRVERMCIIIEISLEKMLVASTNRVLMIYTYRYNFWWGMLEKEIDSNTRIEPHMLKVSFFMETLITGYITYGQKCEEERKKALIYKSKPRQLSGRSCPENWIEMLAK